MSILGLSLFNGDSKGVTESVSVDLNEYVGIQPDEDSLHTMYMEAAMDLSALHASTLVVDVIATETAVMQSEDAANLLIENAITDMLGKLKQHIINLWKKVKAWFLKMVENVRIFFMSGEKFIKEYESAIKSKNLKDFETKTFPYDLSGESKVDRMINLCENERKLFLQNLEAVIAKVGEESVAESDLDEMIEKGKEDLFKDLDVNNESELSEKVDDHLGMKNGKEDIKDFSKGLTKDQMIAMVKDGKKLTDKINQQMKDSDGAFKDLIAKIDKAANKKDLPSSTTSKIRKFSSILTTINGYSQKIFGRYVANRETMFKESIRVLKSYMYYRGSKEDKKKAAGITESASTTVFESFSL